MQPSSKPALLTEVPGAEIRPYGRVGRGAFAGIDTIAVKGEVRTAERDRARTVRRSRFVDWDTAEVHRDQDITRMPSGARLTLNRTAAGLSATMEFSAPKQLYGSNFEPSPAIDVFRAIEDAYAEASEKVFLAEIESVRAGFRADPTLAGRCMTINPTVGSFKGLAGLQLEKQEQTNLGGVWCHYAELRMVAQELI